jgi:hypothetical protein
MPGALASRCFLFCAGELDMYGGGGDKDMIELAKT